MSRALADADCAYDELSLARVEEDEKLAEISRDLSLGRLSPEEAVLAPGFNPIDPRDPELATTLLYYHLDVARKRRMFLDRTEWSQEWVTADRERHQAIADAHRHYRALLGLPNGAAYIDPYLAQMVATEGLTP